MTTELKYFRGPRDHVVSNGVLKITFTNDVIAVDDAAKIDLLKKSNRVVEIDEDEAMALYPQLFKESSEDSEEDKNKPTKPLTRDELEAQAKELGVSEEDIKNAKNKGEVSALIEAAKKEAE